MTITQLLNILYPLGQANQLTPQQEAIVRHPQGPAWVLAGPGSGKTEVLTVMVLRLLYVDNDPVQSQRVPPESIFITTFTDKAARNLEDRIVRKRTVVLAQDSSLSTIDISKLRIGTLHGLCNDLLQEFRSTNYQNVRLMDEFEQGMFIYEQMSITRAPNPVADRAFWANFPYLFSPRDWQPQRNYPPSKWNTSAALVQLFNRIVEDRVSVPNMRAAGAQWARLADLYDEYANYLQTNYRCDFAHLQLRFLDFLGTQLGRDFRDGDGTTARPGIRWVLVDEYQDTNPIQEEIYFRLAARTPYNLVVVGDDDQAMYRYRGGSVECMVTFNKACQVFLNINPTAVAPYPLATNFRSHPDVVEFCNQYVTAFPVMLQAGSRAPGKTALVAGSTINGNYPAVGTLAGATVADAAQRFAQTVRDLISNGVVQNANQCCLLLRSTRESPNNAEPYVNALRTVGLQPYNPRNKAFLEQEEVEGLLGALLTIVDRNGNNVPQNPQSIQNLNAAFRATYARLVTANPPLSDYVARCHAALLIASNRSIANGQPVYLTSNLQEIVYYILSRPPFDGWQNDPVRRVRLARLTKLFESYSSMPVPGRPNIFKGSMRVSQQSPGEIVNGWLGNFYHLFIGYLSRTGFDDEEDEDVICPPGFVPLMTMHQAKGLEFPFVFVGHMGNSSDISASHYIEATLRQFPLNAVRVYPLQPPQTRADLDLIRQYFVAFSRAQYALILLGSNQQFTRGAIPCGPTRSWLRLRSMPL